MHNYWHPKLNKGKKISYLEKIQNKINLNQFPFNTKIAKELGFSNIKQLIKINASPNEYDSGKIFKFYKEIFSQLLKIDKKKIITTDHHTNHAAYALYGSPIRDDKTLIVTADAYGDGLSGSVSRYNKSLNKIEKLKDYKHNRFQLARIYRFTTLYLRANVPTLSSRLQNERGHRPLIAHLADGELSEFIGKHLFERGKFYEKSKLIVDVNNKSETEVLSDVKKLIESE